MIEVGYVRQMAAYNLRQNQNILEEASTLEPLALEADRGAFFSSLRRTMSDILWADLMWLHPYSGSEKPSAPIFDSPEYVDGWPALERMRPVIDQRLKDWAADLDPAWLAGDLE